MHLGRKVKRKGVLRQKDLLSVVPSPQARVVLTVLALSFYTNMAARKSHLRGLLRNVFSCSLVLIMGCLLSLDKVKPGATRDVRGLVQAFSSV